MTGFGRAEKNVGDKHSGRHQITEWKTIWPCNRNRPASWNHLEFDIRRIFSEKLGRGTVDCTISLKDTGSARLLPSIPILPKPIINHWLELSAALNLTLPYSEHTGKTAGSDYTQQARPWPMQNGPTFSRYCFLLLKTWTCTARRRRQMEDDLFTRINNISRPGWGDKIRCQ